MVELITSPLLPDGSAAPSGEDAALLVYFRDATATFPTGFNTLRRALGQFRKNATSEYAVSCAIERLQNRGFLIEVPNPGPRMKAPAPINLLGVPRPKDVYLAGDPQAGERSFLATPIGRKAACLASHQPYAFAPWMLGAERLVDQMLLAFIPPFGLTLEQIDAACCCNATVEVVATLERPSTRLLVCTNDSDGPRFKLTADGEDRAIAVRSELQAAWTDWQAQKAVASMQTTGAIPDPKAVFVIHGRNNKARAEMCIFLRACGLRPINFGDLRSEMGGTPTIDRIVEEGMRRAQGIIALFTPDEYATLVPELRQMNDDSDAIARRQARPNVIFEAGMAFGRDRNRVVFVVLGDTKLFTDVAGVHSLRPTNSVPGDRTVLHDALKKSLGCSVEDTSDWMTQGDFEACINRVDATSPTESNSATSDCSNASTDVEGSAGSGGEETHEMVETATRTIFRPRELEHPYFHCSLTLLGKSRFQASGTSHVEQYWKVRLLSPALARNSFLPLDERKFVQQIHSLFPADGNAHLADPDPSGMAVLHTDAEFRFARAWNWTAGGILGMGSSLPMVLAPDRYCVSDMLDDLIRFMKLAIGCGTAGDAIVWFELVAPELPFQIESLGRFQTSLDGQPCASKPGIGCDRIVELVFLDGCLTHDKIESSVVELVHQALTFVHKTRIEPELLHKIAARLFTR